MISILGALEHYPVPHRGAKLMTNVTHSLLWQSIETHQSPIEPCHA